MRGWDGRRYRSVQEERAIEGWVYKGRNHIQRFQRFSRAIEAVMHGFLQLDPPTLPMLLPRVTEPRADEQSHCKDTSVECQVQNAQASHWTGRESMSWINVKADKEPYTQHTSEWMTRWFLIRKELTTPKCRQQLLEPQVHIASERSHTAGAPQQSRTRTSSSSCRALKKARCLHLSCESLICHTLVHAVWGWSSWKS